MIGLEKLKIINIVLTIIIVYTLLYFFFYIIIIINDFLTLFLTIVDFTIYIFIEIVNCIIETHFKI